MYEEFFNNSLTQGICRGYLQDLVCEGQAKRGTQALKENGFDIADAAKQLEKIYLKLAEH